MLRMAAGHIRRSAPSHVKCVQSRDYSWHSSAPRLVFVKKALVMCAPIVIPDLQ
jgi:hypothetical protein